jgi:hypothetical protein
MNELTDTPNILISGEWQAILFLGAFFVVNIAITSFLSSYFKKRGEDYAYKQVAADITKAVESIKSEFTEKIERLKSELIGDIGRSQYLY